jgi:hypothetical protein
MFTSAVWPVPIGLGLTLRKATVSIVTLGFAPDDKSPTIPEVAPCIGLPGITSAAEALAVNAADISKAEVIIRTIAIKAKDFRLKFTFVEFSIFVSSF